MGTSIMGRAQDKGALQLGVHDLREYGIGRHRQVDDTPYGGGQGMLLRPEPLFAALQSLTGEPNSEVTPSGDPVPASSISHPATEEPPSSPRIILMTPAGHRFDQAAAERLSKEPHLIFISGHYEGVDHRVVEHWVHEELSIGDYVLTNGAIAAVVVMDAITRLLPGVLGDDLSAVEESFGGTGENQGLLEAPHYTKPAEFHGRTVPEVLLSGNHAKIAQWRRTQARERTRRNRPDLLLAQELQRPEDSPGSD